ncbi:scopoletin glucosyltransferase-like [Iris pallida]|uniref:Glycosyltransferase n=1 Tax=Iris pallida TaxID=29817 RepID=A0AAX6I961_IRIPA|nr:scopoletin glucosyltransferase-like [Iris pallida]
MDVHIFFLPFLAPGHMIPMTDLAKLLAGRGVKATIVTTTANASRVQPALDGSPHLDVTLLTLPFLPSVPENVTSLPTPGLTPEFIAGLNSLKSSFERLLVEHRPDCIISDVFYPWTGDLAAEHGIPRIAFHGTGSFVFSVGAAIRRFKPHEIASADDEPFLLPGLPHRVELCRSQLMGRMDGSDELMNQMTESYMKKTYGDVMNTFHEMEPGYADQLSKKTWLVGPVSLCNRDATERAVRGGGGGGQENEFDRCLDWLDSKSAGSVLYACFGSLGQFSSSQLGEIAGGLNSSGRPFVWVVRNNAGYDDTSEWMPEGFEEEEGLVIRGWAPQMLILSHPAVGGFMTHCGWNSCMEGASAGVPMVTWPLFAEQFFNERLLVDVLGIGVAVGSKVCSNVVEERTFVSREQVRKAVEEVMGGGEEADERRKRAREVAEMARRAVEEGGSSYNGLSSLIQELRDIKAGDAALSENVVAGLTQRELIE